MTSLLCAIFLPWIAPFEEKGYSQFLYASDVWDVLPSLHKR